MSPYGADCVVMGMLTPLGKAIRGGMEPQNLSVNHVFILFIH